jgi:hypothetical protein
MLQSYRQVTLDDKRKGMAAAKLGLAIEEAPKVIEIGRAHKSAHRSGDDEG